MEQTEDIRYTDGIKKIYQQRKETIERVYDNAKEKHGMRYTQYRRLAKVKMELNILFGCMNLKRTANWKWKYRTKPCCYMKFYCFNLINMKKDKLVKKLLA